MNNNLNNLFEAIKNGFLGLWNNVGIGFRVVLIPIALLTLLTLLSLWILKYGMIIINVLVKEVNFYWYKWKVATSTIISVLDEFGKNIVLPIIEYLWFGLIGDKEKLQTIPLRKKWLKVLIINFVRQLYFFCGVLLILITFSSLIYSTILHFSFTKFELINIWILRSFLVFPLFHQKIRFIYFPQIPDNKLNNLRKENIKNSDVEEECVLQKPDLGKKKNASNLSINSGINNKSRLISLFYSNLIFRFVVYLVFSLIPALVILIFVDTRLYSNYVFRSIFGNENFFWIIVKLFPLPIGFSLFVTIMEINDLKLSLYLLPLRGFLIGAGFNFLLTLILYLFPNQSITLPLDFICGLNLMFGMVIFSLLYDDDMANAF